MEFRIMFYDYNHIFQAYEYKKSNQVECSDYPRFILDAYE